MTSARTTPHFRIKEVDRRQRQREGFHQPGVEHAGGAVKEGEGQRHQEGRQGDESVDQPGDEAAAWKRHEGKDQRQHQADDQASGRRRDRDRHRVEQRVEEEARMQDADDLGDIGDAAVVEEGLAYNQRQRVEEQQCQQGRRRHDPQPARLSLSGRRHTNGERFRHRRLPEEATYRPAQRTAAPLCRVPARPLAVSLPRRAPACRQHRAPDA